MTARPHPPGLIRSAVSSDDAAVTAARRKSGQKPFATAKGAFRDGHRPNIMGAEIGKMFERR
jgi:hypothetical protein